MNNLKRQTTNGSTIIESLVAIALVGFLLLIFEAGSTAIMSNRYIKHQSLAYNIAAEEIEAIRSTPFAQLTNRTDSAFIEVVYNVGHWSVQQVAGAPSSPYVFGLLPPTPTASGVTGTAVVPGFDYGNFTYETKVKVTPSSPATWQGGLYFRYHDTANYYATYFSATNLYLEKKVNGVSASLNSKLKAFSTDTWYTLKVVATDSAFEVYVNSTLELSATDADNSFTAGRLALLGVNAVSALFDDVTVTTGSSQTWNFDTETVDDIPTGWKRFGLGDLPSGQGKLTIQDVRSGFSDLKQITAKVEWEERNHVRSNEIVTYLNEQSVSL